jgi:hypothetical protein
MDSPNAPVFDYGNVTEHNRLRVAQMPALGIPGLPAEAASVREAAD